MSLLLLVLIGLPLALWTGRSRSLAAKCVSFFVTLPLVFPPIALGYMLLRILGRTGALGRLLEDCGVRIVFSQTGVFLAAFIAALPLFVRPLQAAFGSGGIIRLEQAARVAGCGPFRTFAFVTALMAKGTIASGLLLGAARASGEVGVTMMLGGNISGRTNTLSLEIFNCVSRGEFDRATGLCAILAVAGLIMYVILELLQNKRGS